MLDIGWQELMIVGTLAIIVVGPKDLPRALRTVMNGVRKARGIAREFQSGVDEMVREADLDDIRQELKKVSKGDISKTISDAIDPDGELKKNMDMTDVQKDLDKIAKDTTSEKTAEKAADKTAENAPEEIEKPTKTAQNN